MPTYTYQVVTPAGDGEMFEVEQAMDDPVLARHPESGARVRRVYTPPHLPLRHGDAAAKAITSDSNVARHGFTKYVREGRGHYRKAAGQHGPDHLNPL